LAWLFSLVETLRSRFMCLQRPWNLKVHSTPINSPLWVKTECSGPVGRLRTTAPSPACVLPLWKPMPQLEPLQPRRVTGPVDQHRWHTLGVVRMPSSQLEGAIMQHDFVSLLAFNRWANATMLEACRKLSPESGKPGRGPRWLVGTGA